MTKSIKFVAAWVVLASVSTVSAGTGGPTSALYLTGYDPTAGYPNSGNAIAIVQGSSITSFTYAYGSVEWPIAVDGDVRTIGFTNGVSQGGQYTLAGAPTFTPYTRPSFPDRDDAALFDSTTDGTRNYLVDRWDNHTNDSIVYATDRDYTNLTPLFTIDDPGNTGITYDATNKSLWLAAGGMVANYSMTGTFLSSFSIGHDTGALALDHADQTLWLVNIAQGDANFGYLEQYSKSGSFLALGPYLAKLYQDEDTSYTGVYTYGGEFNLSAPVPELSTLVMLSMGGLLLAFRRRQSGCRQILRT